MGMFSFSDQEIADEATKAASAAWDGGRAVFAYQLRMGVGSKNDDNQLLDLALNQIVALGWRLHSVIPYINTIGPNREIALITFER